MPKALQHHQNNFTFLRHLAAFLVLYAHCITVNGQEEFIFRLTLRRLELSSFGVKIFFVISGYLVTNSLLQSKNAVHFVRNRILRLWPALISVTFLLAMVAGPMLSTLRISAYFNNAQTWLFLIRNILFLPVYYLPGVFNGQAVNSTFWSIFFEAVCYAGLIILGKRFLCRHTRGLAISWVLVAIWKYAVPPLFRWPTFLHPYSYGISDMMFLFYSASIWLLVSKGKNFSAKRIYISALVVFLLSFITVIPLKLSVFLQDASLIFFVIEWGRAKPVFKWPNWDISYGTYLLAFPIEMIFLHHTQANLYGSKMIFIVTLLVTIPLAFGCWYLVEKPALKAKQLKTNGNLL
ncbi:acyltransferase [soil metagenome]